MTGAFARPRPAARPLSVWPVVLAGFTAFLDLYATQPLLPLLAGVFHASRLAVSLTVTAPTIAVAIAAPIAGRIGDRFGRRQTIVTASLAMAVTTALAATSRTLPQLVFWRFLQGLATPGVFAVAIAYVHDQWPAERAGAATSAYISGTIVGGFSGRIVSGTVASAIGWPAVFVTLAVLNTAAWAMLWTWLPTDRPHPVRPRQHAESLDWSGLTHPNLLATYGVGFCILFAIVGTFSYVTFYLAAPPFSLSTAALGYLFVVYLAGAGMTTVGGPWIDRFGHRNGLMAAVAVGSMGTLMTLGHSLTMVVSGLAVFCAGIFVAQATATSHVGAASRNRGTAVGLYATAYYAGGSLGGSLPALVWDAGGWPACVALVVAVQLTMGVVGRLWWRDAHRGFGAEAPPGA